MNLTQWVMFLFVALEARHLKARPIDHYDLVPPDEAPDCTPQSKHDRFAHCEVPGRNSNAQAISMGLPTLNGGMCCDLVARKNNLGYLCFCEAINKSHSPAATKGTAPTTGLPRTIEADMLFVLPHTQTHAPHWLEELAQLCNALSLAVTTANNRSITVMVEQPFVGLSALLAGGRAAVSAFARSRPDPAIDDLPPNLQYADDFSSMATAALLQHSVQNIVTLPDRCAEAKHYGPKCTNGGFLAFHYSDDKASHATVKPELVAGVVSSRQIHRHASTKEHPHTGKHFFASPASCNIFRNAIRPLWDDTFIKAAAAGKLLPSTPRTVRFDDGMNVIILNRPSGNRNISNVGDLETALRAAFPSATVQSHVREHDKFAAQLRVFAEADVLISAHGGALVGVPAMAPGALLVEVFSWPAFQGTALSYFMRLGSNCGVMHRVYHEAVPGGPLKQSHTWSLQSWPAGSVVFNQDTKAPEPITVGHPIDPEQIIAMIHEWQEASGALEKPGSAESSAAAAQLFEDRLSEPALSAQGSEPSLKGPLPCKGANPDPSATSPSQCRGKAWWMSAELKEKPIRN